MSDLKVHFLNNTYWPEPESEDLEDIEFSEGWVYDEGADVVVIDYPYNEDLNWNNVRTIDAEVILVRGVMEGMEDYEDYEIALEEIRDELESDEYIEAAGEVLLYHNGISPEKAGLTAQMLEHYDRILLDGALSEVYDALEEKEY